MSSLAQRLYFEARSEVETSGTEWRRRQARRVILEGVDIEPPLGPALCGHTVDVTPRSMGIACKSRVPVNTRLTIRRALGAAHEYCTGIVVQCTQSLTGHRVGVRICAAGGEAEDLNATAARLRRTRQSRGPSAALPHPDRGELGERF